MTLPCFLYRHKCWAFLFGFISFNYSPSLPLPREYFSFVLICNFPNWEEKLAVGNDFIMSLLTSPPVHLTFCAEWHHALCHILPALWGTCHEPLSSCHWWSSSTQKTRFLSCPRSSPVLTHSAVPPTWRDCFWETVQTLASWRVPDGGPLLILEFLSDALRL
jgi:hypothetical protein